MFFFLNFHCALDMRARVASVVRIYHEEIFPKLAVNGWSLKRKASEVDVLVKSVDDLKTALSQLEAENGVFKTRIDNLQISMVKMESNFSETEEILRNAIGNLWEKVYGWSDFRDMKREHEEEES